MYPYLIKFGKFVIPSYGFMLALSFLFGLWIASRLARKNGLDANAIYDVGFWVMLSAIVGSRLYYVLLHFEEFKGNLTNIFNPFQGETIGIGGLVMFGGFIGAVIAGVIFFKVRKLPFLPYADAVAPGICFGVFLTRIGCFLNGCCYGKGTTSSCGVHFPQISPAGDYQLSIHADKLVPSQLIESAGGLVIGIIILALARKKPMAGTLFYLTGISYAVLRFGVEFTRFYTPDETLFSLTHNQIVCIVLFISFSALLIRDYLKYKKSGAPIQPVPQPPRNGESSSQLNHGATKP